MYSAHTTTPNQLNSEGVRLYAWPLLKNKILLKIIKLAKSTLGTLFKLALKRIQLRKNIFISTSYLMHRQNH